MVKPIAEAYVDSDIIKKIIFSGEAIFHTSGHMNIHNSRYWAAQNPNKNIEKVRSSLKVNVWSVERTIGPYFLA